MRIRTRRILCVLFSLLTVGMLAAVWRLLPDQVPCHWDFKGQVEYDSKNTLWMLAGMQIFFNGMFEVLPHIDPRKRNYQKFMEQYNVFCVFMNFFFTAFLGAVLIQSLAPGSFSMPRFVWFMVGLMLLVMGNMMPKFKSNFYSGIKTPWALSDDENWRKTHRLGGKLLFLTGIIWILSAVTWFNQNVVLVLGIGSLCVAVMAPFIMSYVWWKKGKDGDETV